MTNRLYVGNLSWAATQDALEERFTECGEVVEARIVTERESGRSCGFAFVTMTTEAEANYAVTRLDHTMFEGQPLRVNLDEQPSAHSDRGGRSW